MLQDWHGYWWSLITLQDSSWICKALVSSNTSWSWSSSIKTGTIPAPQGFGSLEPLEAMNWEINSHVTQISLPRPNMPISPQCMDFTCPARWTTAAETACWAWALCDFATSMEVIRLNIIFHMTILTVLVYIYVCTCPCIYIYISIYIYTNINQPQCIILHSHNFTFAFWFWLGWHTVRPNMRSRNEGKAGPLQGNMLPKKPEKKHSANRIPGLQPLGIDNSKQDGQQKLCFKLETQVH